MASRQPHFVPNQHSFPLQSRVNDPGLGHSCDICEARLGLSDGFRSFGIDYDLCSNCFVKQHPHTLEVYFPSHIQHLTQNEWVCDNCRKVCEPVRFKCSRGCDFDLCGTCFANIHPHSLSPAKSDSQCNICKTLQPGDRFRCSFGCDMTVCIKCFTHHHPHQLIETKKPGQWQCDRCESKNPRSRFACVNKCDFDYCITCYVRAHPHPVLRSDLKSSWQCDSCSKVTKDRYRCQFGCDFDLCSTCFTSIAPVNPAPNNINNIPTGNNIVVPPFGNNNNANVQPQPVVNVIVPPQSVVNIQPQPLVNVQPPAPVADTKVRETPDSPMSDTQEGLNCIICEEMPKQVVFLPCKHLCCCNGCAKLFTSKKPCPICRANIDSDFTVFIV